MGHWWSAQMGQRNALRRHCLEAFDGLSQEFWYALASIMKLIQDPLKLVLLALNPIGWQ
jgi:hypothetical protein